MFQVAASRDHEVPMDETLTLDTPGSDAPAGAGGLLPDVAAFLAQFVEQESYGAFPGGDPRLFHPDPECSTAREREAHRLACEAWERGERPEIEGGCSLVRSLASAKTEVEPSAPPTFRDLLPRRFPFAFRDEAGETVIESIAWPRFTVRAATRSEATVAARAKLRDLLAAADEGACAEALHVHMLPAAPSEEPQPSPEPIGFGLGTYTYSDEDVASLLGRVRAAMGTTKEQG